MSKSNIPVVDLEDLHAGGARRAQFIATMGHALEDIGFFALRGHGMNTGRLREAYATLRAFYGQPDVVKARYELAHAKGQRGYTGFGKEHAKGQAAPDLKEFWQVGRTDVADTHPLHATYGPNVWPDVELPEFRRVFSRMYEDLDALGGELLACVGEYLGDDVHWYRDAIREGDTILRLIHYPPVPAGSAPSSIRAGAHEDINFITLLVGATEPGLELLQRDGSWLAVQAFHDEIIVDSGDMLQNCTNGRMKSTTHRVVRPPDERSDVPRFSMPCFIHPRGEVDLSPRAACVAHTGGQPNYPSTTAREYLTQRLREIGIG